MDRKYIQKITSHVAASYASRELDRVWLDRFMETRIGQKLKDLSPGKQKAVELISYVGSAYVIHRDTDPSALRAFITTVLSDIPPEIAKRLIADQNGSDPSLAIKVLDNLDDEGLIILSGGDIQIGHGKARSTVVRLTENINDARKKVRAKRRILGKND